MASGVEPVDVYVEILAPALHGIGSGWQAGTISIEREHLASSVAAAIVGRMGPRFRRRGRHLGSVIIAMPVGERHGLGAAMLADIVTDAGYEVLNVGPDTPPASLAAAIRSRDDLRSVVVSVVDASRLPAGARLIAAARSANGQVPIIAGGFAIPDPQTAARLGADSWAADPRRLPALIGERAAIDDGRDAHEAIRHPHDPLRHDREHPIAAACNQPRIRKEIEWNGPPHPLSRCRPRHRLPSRPRPGPRRRSPSDRAFGAWS